LQKASISLIVSVCTKQLSSSKDFHEIWYLSIFQKSFKEIQVSLKSDKNNAFFYMKTDIQFWSYLSQFFLEWEIFQTEIVQKIKHAIYIQ